MLKPSVFTRLHAHWMMFNNMLMIHFSTCLVDRWLLNITNVTCTLNIYWWFFWNNGHVFASICELRPLKPSPDQPSRLSETNLLLSEHVWKENNYILKQILRFRFSSKGMANYFRNYCLLISPKKQHEYVLLFDVRLHESKSNANNDFVRTTSKDRYSIKKT